MNTHKLEISNEGKALAESMRHVLAVNLWANRGIGKSDRKGKILAAAIQRISGHVCDRIENPRFRKTPEEKVHGKIAWTPDGLPAYRPETARITPGTIGKNGKVRRGKNPAILAVEDSARFGFKEIRLSQWDREEIRGAVSLVFSGAVQTGSGDSGDENGAPVYAKRAGLWESTLNGDDWKALFRASRACLLMDKKSGPGARSETVSLEALQDLCGNDFHAGLASGKSACDLETNYQTESEWLCAQKREVDSRIETATRARHAKTARAFRLALLAARLEREKRKSRVFAAKEFRANSKTLRNATRAIAGNGHGLSVKRRDRKSSRTMHGIIGRFTRYLATGFLAQADCALAGKIRNDLETALRISLTATANC